MSMTRKQRNRRQRRQKGAYVAPIASRIDRQRAKTRSQPPVVFVSAARSTDHGGRGWG
jgi:hypothetical protein